jgi:hypothetical protein
MVQRIQLRRTKWWRKPERAVVVARPSRWGNPIRIDDDRPAAAAAFAEGLAARRAAALPDDHPFHGYPTDDEIRSALAGRDLACWCATDQPCHGDVLLAVANRRSSAGPPSVP